MNVMSMERSLCIQCDLHSNKSGMGKTNGGGERRRGKRLFSDQPLESSVSLHSSVDLRRV